MGVIYRRELQNQGAASAAQLSNRLLLVLNSCSSRTVVSFFCSTSCVSFVIPFMK